MATAIVDVDCITAEDLLDKLSRQNPLWSGNRHFWVFRGLQDARFTLVPSALRDTPAAQLGYTAAPKEGRQWTNEAQIKAEFERVHEFYWAADSQGLPIAGNSDLLRTPRGWKELRDKIDAEGWPIGDLLPLLALAQHYSVATRLLDWTDKPLVSAHFAARRAAEEIKNAAKEKSPPKWSHLSLWALNLDWVIHEGFPGNMRKINVYVVTAPRASNPNLHAQGGVFTTEHIIRSEFGKRTFATPVNHLVEQRWMKLKSRPTHPIMARFRLPLKESPTLLRLLHQEGISAATLFPGYHGVADSLSERALWDKPDRASYWVKP